MCAASLDQGEGIEQHRRAAGQRGSSCSCSDKLHTSRHTPPSEKEEEKLVSERHTGHFTLDLVPMASPALKQSPKIDSGVKGLCKLPRDKSGGARWYHAYRRSLGTKLAFGSHGLANHSSMRSRLTSPPRLVCTRSSQIIAPGVMFFPWKVLLYLGTRVGAFPESSPLSVLLRPPS